MAKKPKQNLKGVLKLISVRREDFERLSKAGLINYYFFVTVNHTKIVYYSVYCAVSTTQ